MENQTTKMNLTNIFLSCLREYLSNLEEKSIERKRDILFNNKEEEQERQREIITKSI